MMCPDQMPSAAVRRKPKPKPEPTDDQPDLFGSAASRQADPPSGRPASLEDAMAQLERAGALSPDTLRRMRSDLNTCATATKVSLDRLPCDPVQLGPTLRKVLPARSLKGLTLLKAGAADARRGSRRKRWSNVKSTIRRVLFLTGWIDAKEGCKNGLTAAWRAVVDRLERKADRGVMGGFARFCMRLGITPDQVTQETWAAYRAWRLDRTLDLTPGKTVARVRSLWNGLGNDPTWQGVRFSPPARATQVALATPEFDPAFLLDLHAYIECLTHPDPFNRKFKNRLASTTILNRRAILLRCASVLMRQGHPITAVRCLLTPEAVKAVLMEHYERVGHGRWAPSAATVASTLLATALQWGGLSDADIAAVREVTGMVPRADKGLSPKNQHRIDQFDDPELLKRLLTLPDDCFRAADRQWAEGHRHTAAILHETALALAILLVKPLRRANLTALCEHRHFTLADDGNGHLKIPAAECKGPRPINAIIPAAIVKRMQRHKTLFRPHLGRCASDYLFPGAKAGHIHPCHLAHRITRLVETQVGAEFNVHAVRHLIVTLLLDADPRNMPLAQRLLDHGQMKITERTYGQQRSRGAQREWMGMLERARRPGSAA